MAMLSLFAGTGAATTFPGPRVSLEDVSIMTDPPTEVLTDGADEETMSPTMGETMAGTIAETTAGSEIDMGETPEQPGGSASFELAEAECSPDMPCEVCQGDCDDDADCAGDLLCYRRYVDCIHHVYL